MQFKSGWVWVMGIMYAVAILLSIQLLPIDDDWFFLKYFPGCGDWEVESYPWLWGNHLLPRDYWRPLEDILLGAQTHAVTTYPWLNHVLVVTFCFASLLMLYPLGRKLGIEGKYLWPSIALGVALSNNMGALLSIDSLTHVLATFFGLLSVFVFCCKGWKRWPLWIITGMLACISKESGCVYFVIGPLFYLISTKGDRMKFGRLFRQTPKYIAIGIVPALIYLGTYYILKQQQPPEAPPSVEIVEAAAIQGDGILEQISTSQRSHHLSVSTLVKNVYVLYGAGVYPADTSALYYGQYKLLVFSVILSLGGLWLCVRILRNRRSPRRYLLLPLSCLWLISSLPSLVTRAGEISPFISNVWLLLVVAAGVEGMKWKGTDYVALALFLSATLLTDAHKYSLALRGGLTARDMAERIKMEMPEVPESVVWIGPDEYNLDRAGAAFSKSAYRAFRQGEAVLPLYDYKAPSKLHKVYLPATATKAQIDSAVKVNLPHCDYVWLTQDTIIKVIHNTTIP